MGPEFRPVFGASEYWHISQSSENGHILEPAFWCWLTPKCQPGMLALNTYRNNQVKTCCILTKRSAGEVLVVHTFSKGFSVLKMDP